jgi:hypothetical protein
VSDIDTAVADSLTALDLKRPIREANVFRVTLEGEHRSMQSARLDGPGSCDVVRIGYRPALQPSMASSK